MTSPQVLTHHSPEELARDVAARLVARIAEIQHEGRVPSVVLAGGTVADIVHRAVATVVANSDVDWAKVDFWFGDERYVDADSPDRNAGQAAAAMLDHLPVDPARVHVMPAADGPHGDDVAAAAASYAEELRQAEATRADVEGGTLFDVLMLGVGPDGHCASLFPDHPALAAEGAVVPVHDAPKPPPTRISLSAATLNRADEVWLVAAGAAKADAVAQGVGGADPVKVPAAGPRGRVRTIWFVDREAAAHL